MNSELDSAQERRPCAQFARFALSWLEGASTCSAGSSGPSLCFRAFHKGERSACGGLRGCMGQDLRAACLAVSPAARATLAVAFVGCETCFWHTAAQQRRVRLVRPLRLVGPSRSSVPPATGPRQLQLSKIVERSGVGSAPRSRAHCQDWLPSRPPGCKLQVPGVLLNSRSPPLPAMRHLALLPLAILALAVSERARVAGSNNNSQ